MRRLAVLALVGAALAAGCGSPEANRTRGSESGGDPGNRPSQVMMHEGSQQYYGTPVLIPAEAPSLAPADHARSISLPGSANRAGTGGESSRQ